MVYRLVLLIGLGAFVGLLGVNLLLSDKAEAQSLDYRNKEVVERGKTVYTAQCASCHGKNLEGQPKWQTRKLDGKLPAPPHDKTGHTWHHPDKLLIRLTKHGVGGKDYKSDMPAYDGVLSEDDILASLAYIKSTWPQKIQLRHDKMNAQAGN